MGLTTSGSDSTAASSELIPAQAELHDLEDHGTQPLQAGEVSRFWRPRATAGVELLYGRYSSFAFTRHFHPVAAVGVVETGGMRSYWEGKEYTVPSQTVILFNAGDVHAPQAAADGGWSFRMLYFDDPVAESFFRHNQPFGRPFVEDRRLASALLRAHRSFQREELALQSESLLVSSLEPLSRYTRGARGSSAFASGAKIDLAQEYLRENCTRNVALSQLAQAAGLSAYHLVRSFRRQVGLTPHAYLMQARIERCQALLRAGCPLAETALKAGFVDQSHFTRHFKRFTGVTPGQYR